MEYLYIFGDTVYGFFALFFITKILGKTQIRQLTAFDFISALLLGELVGNALYDKDITMIHMTLAVLTWGSMMYIAEFITQRYKGSRALIEGKPSIIIRNGKLDREVMKKSKLDVNQLQHLLRLKDVFSMRDVEYAILENDGTVSVLEKSASQPPNRGDLELQDKAVFLPITIINDGEIIYDNLKEIKRDKDWLMKQLKYQNVKSISDVFYAEYQEKEPLHIHTM